MIYLTKKNVELIHIISRTHEDDQKDRQFFLGVFEPGNTVNDVEHALSRAKLWNKVLATESLSGAAGYRVSIIPRGISEGAIFENIEECLNYLKTGVTYDDINEGYQVKF